MWKCTECGEACPDDIPECWKCSKPRWKSISDGFAKEEHDKHMEFQAEARQIQVKDSELVSLQLENAKRFSSLLDELGSLVEALRRKLE